MEEIHGFVESIVFAQEESGFTVAKLKEPRKPELTCIVGLLPSIQPGETLRCRGAWKHHPEYGRQFEVETFDLQAPSDLLGIQKYLESGMIKGIGPVYAERIIAKFGLNTLDVIDQRPRRLTEIPGIGKKRIETIERCWQEHKAIRNVMIFLRGHGVSPAYAQKIFKAYGDKSIEKVTANPYALAKELFGVGFKTADGIAKGLGISQESPIRIDAGIEHTLWELSNEGHTCYPEEELMQSAEEMLGLGIEKITTGIERLVAAGSLIRERGLIWIKPLFLCEVGISRELARLKQTPSILRTIDTTKALAWVQEQLRIELAPEQKAAVLQGVTEKLQIVTGGPGTGKSTITRAILTITAKLTKKIILAAPTGRAAKRMAEITRHYASTIHSLLEMDFSSGGFRRNRDNPLEGDLLIIDEASMIDTQLMYHLLKAIPSHCRTLFIGDVDQLPSVGPGNVLKDMISTHLLPTTELKQIFRQARGSRIIVNAHRINQGHFPDLETHPTSDFEFIPAEEPEEILKQIVDQVSTQLPKTFRFHRFDDIQVLAPMKKGIIGTENLNQVLQKTLNPQPPGLQRMGRYFSVGDKVMQIRNNYQKRTFNGDVGKIVSLDTENQILSVSFDGHLVPYEFAEVDELVLAYAVSIHKYQGSECPCVVIPVHTSHFKLLYRNLLYTGVTRGKKRVVLIGSTKAIAMAIKNMEVHNRYTGLAHQLSLVLK